MNPMIYYHEFPSRLSITQELSFYFLHHYLLLYLDPLNFCLYLIVSLLNNFIYLININKKVIFNNNKIYNLIKIFFLLN